MLTVTHLYLNSAQAILFLRRNHFMIINLTFYGCKGKISSCNSSKPSRSIEHQWTVVFSLIKVLNPYCVGFTNDTTCKMSMHVKWKQCGLSGGKSALKCKMTKKQFYSVKSSYLLFLMYIYILKSIAKMFKNI